MVWAVLSTSFTENYGDRMEGEDIISGTERRRRTVIGHREPEETKLLHYNLSSNYTPVSKLQT